MFKKPVCALALMIVTISPLCAFCAIPTFKTFQSPAPSFEVATIKPTSPDERARYMIMQGAHQFLAKGYTVRSLIAAAYNLPPRAVSGGADWADLDRFDILAATPGETRPSVDEQLAMVRTLLKDRFNLKFHTEAKEFSVYLLSVAKGGMRLRDSAKPDEQPMLVSTVYAGDRIAMPARNATMALFASTLQKGHVDRPVLDRTELLGKYDFDLEYQYDDSNFGGTLPPIKPENSGKPDLFAALQQQLGLKLESSRAAIDIIVIDTVQKPSEN